MSERSATELVLKAYAELWSETDPARQRELLARCWSEDSEIVGPGYHFKGTQAVLDELHRFHCSDPGVRPVLLSGIDGHGRWARFAFALLDADDRQVNEGWDFVELADDGRIRRVVSFWGALPPLPLGWPARLLPPGTAAG